MSKRKQDNGGLVDGAIIWAVEFIIALFLVVWVFCSVCSCMAG